MTVVNKLRERRRGGRNQDSYHYVTCVGQEVTGHGSLESEHLKNKMHFNYQCLGLQLMRMCPIRQCAQYFKVMHWPRIKTLSHGWAVEVSFVPPDRDVLATAVDIFGKHRNVVVRMVL